MLWLAWAWLGVVALLFVGWGYTCWKDDKEGESAWLDFKCLTIGALLIVALVVTMVAFFAVLPR